MSNEATIRDLIKVINGLLTMTKHLNCNHNGPFHVQYDELQVKMEEDLKRIAEEHELS